MQSAIGTYECRVAKFLVPILQPLALGPYTVKDSLSLVTEIISFHIDSDCVMASFVLTACLLMFPSLCQSLL